MTGMRIRASEGRGEGRCSEAGVRIVEEEEGGARGMKQRKVV